MSAPMASPLPRQPTGGRTGPGRVVTPGEVAKALLDRLGQTDCFMGEDGRTSWEVAVEDAVKRAMRAAYDEAVARLAVRATGPRLEELRDRTRAALTYAGVPARCSCGAPVWRVEDVLGRGVRAFDVDLVEHNHKAPKAATTPTTAGAPGTGAPR